MASVKDIIVKLIPRKLWINLRWLKNNLEYIIFSTQYKRVLNRLKKKQKISVAFYLFNVDTWKADSVYQALEQSERFEPVMVICPFLTKGDAFLNEQYEEVLRFVKKNNYHYIIGFEGQSENTIKQKEIPDFDIVFYLNPNPLTLPTYSVFKNRKSLNCYLPYSFNIDNLIDYEYNNQFLNVMFRIFTMTKYHQNLYKRYSDVKGRNTSLVGFPQLDRYFSTHSEFPWKSKTTKRKKIIWGPHWTIPGLQETGLDWSCFLKYSDLFLEMADKYSDDIELALKPHPFLFQLLGKEENWGRQKLNDYLEEWNTRENCQIHLGDYTDLFLTSDALIHDSGSFLVEYLCIGKPVAYTADAKNIKSRFNEIGEKAISAHTLLENGMDLELFIQNVIFDIDESENKRKKFLENEIYADGNTGKRIVEQLNEILE